MIPVDLLRQKGAGIRKADPGEFLFHEGQKASFYYQLEEGRIRWCHIDDSGKEILHKLVEEGEPFGYFPIFDNRPYGASAVADTPCRIYRLSIPSFHEILATHPEIQAGFMNAMVEELRFKHLVMNAIATKDPQGIMETLIRYFDQKGKLVCKECTRLQLTRQQLANMSGLRVETVVRAIKNLHQEERLCIKKGKVFISP